MAEDTIIIETKVGKYELIKNIKDAFVKEQFDEKFIEECFSRYEYLVGDISGGILRIKGFDIDSKDKSYRRIPDYLNESCAYNCAYFILKKIKK